MEWYKILIAIFILSAVIGISLGLYLSRFCECSDEEDYEATLNYYEAEKAKRCTGKNTQEPTKKKKRDSEE